MAQVNEASDTQLQQQFGDQTASDGALAFQGYVDGDLYLNREKPSRDSRKNLAEAAFNSKRSQHTDSCLEGTRTDVLSQIRTWADGDGERRMYWLKGMAGTGKSTIALTIASEYHEKRRLGASFFFERGGGELASANDFAATVSSQLEDISNPLKKLIWKAASSSSRIDALDLRDQWDKLVVQPLSELTGHELNTPVLIVVDALDECNDEDDMALLIKLLARITTLSSINIRVFITSRPDPPMITGFGAISGRERRDFVLHDIEQSIVDQDIAAYYHYQLSGFNLNEGSSGEDVIQKLVKRSRGLFIHAATVCLFIRDGRALAERRLRSVVENEGPNATAEMALDSIYSTVLEQSLGVKSGTRQSEDLSLSRDFSCVVGSIVTLADAMSVLDLVAIIARSEKDIRRIADSIHSVLDVPSSQESGRTIRLVHPSFRDFLLSPTRNSHKVFSVDARDVHRFLLSRCFNIMATNLRRNMCDFEKPGTQAKDVPKDEVDRKIPRAVQYACRYWVHHLRQSEVCLSENAEEVGFFNETFLFWLETLSWMRQLPEALNMVTELVKIMDISRESQSHSRRAGILALFSKFVPSSNTPTPPPDLRRLLYDADRFIRTHIHAIQDAPLQAYCSGILFSPQSSVIRGLYSNQTPDWISQKSSPTYGWLGLWVSRAESRIDLAAFSPDGSYLAIVLNDRRTLQIMDVVTSIWRDMKMQHSGPVGALSFSPDGQMLLCIHVPDPDSESDSRARFEIVDISTGEGQPLLEGYEERVLSVHFVSESILVLSQSDQGSTRLWDLATGTTRLLLDDPGNSGGAVSPIQCGKLSPDGKYLFSRRKDHTAQLWDVTTGKALPTRANAAEFSPQGKFVALGVGARISFSQFYIWDLKQPWREKFHFIDIFLSWYEVAFSPDCRTMAAVGRHGVSLLDTNSGKGINNKMRTHGLASMAFSHDSKRIAWAFENTIEIWDTASQTPLQKFPHPEIAAYTRAVSFSPNDETLVAVSEDYIQTWDTRETSLQDKAVRSRTKKPASHGAPLVCPAHTIIAASHDHNVVAAAYLWKIEVWAADRGSIIRTLTAAAPIFSMVVSPDGQLVAATTPEGRFGKISDMTSSVVLWHINTGSRQVFHTTNYLNGYDLVFSGDSRVLAAAGSRIVHAWNTTGKELCRFAHGSGAHISIAISHTGDLIMVGLWDQTKVLNVSGILQGAPVQTPLEVGLEGTSIVSLSPDGRLLAACEKSGNRCLQLFDFSGTQIFAHKVISDLLPEGESYEYHECRVLAFSPNGKSLAALFVDNLRLKRGLVRLWDVATGDLLISYEVQHSLKPSYLSFSPCGDLLLTRDGAQRLPGASSHSSPHIFIGDSWIRSGNENLVFLPANYRRSILFVAGNNVVFIDGFQDRLLQFSDSGRYTF